MDCSSTTNHAKRQLETLEDAKTGQIYHVLNRAIKGGVETLVVVASELCPDITGSLKRDRYAFDNAYVGKAFMGLLMEQKLTRSELAILGFLMQHMNKSCSVQVTQSVISEATGIARSNVSTTLKALKERLIIIEDVNPLAPNVPVYLIDPEIAYKGYASAYKFVCKKYGKKMKQQSDARKPRE